MTARVLFLFSFVSSFTFRTLHRDVHAAKLSILCALYSCEQPIRLASIDDPLGKIVSEVLKHDFVRRRLHKFESCLLFVRGGLGNILDAIRGRLDADILETGRLSTAHRAPRRAASR